MKSTYSSKPTEIERQWFVVDAAGKTLGRLSTSIATILQGKHKPMYTLSMDTGDFVVVINAEKIAVTGNKLKDKSYNRHSGYPGGFRSESLQSVLDNRPIYALQHSVKGMLPKGPLGRAMIKKLKLYAGAEHPHSAQQPKSLDI